MSVVAAPPVPAPAAPAPADRGVLVRRIALVALRFAVAAALLVWLFDRSGGMRPVWNVVRAARFDLLLSAFAVTLVVQGLIAHRLRLLAMAQGAGLSTRDVLAINLATLFYGLFLPGGGVTAIAIRFYRLSRDDRRYSAALVAILCDRVLATAALCVVGLCFWFLDGPARSAPAALLLAAGTGVSLLALLSMLTAAPARVIGVVAKRIPIASRHWPSIDQALAAARALSLRGRLWVVALAGAAHVLGAVVYLMLARALAIGTPFVGLGWIRSVAGLITLTPISIAGLGLREGTTVALLSARDVPQATALAYALLVFAITVLAVGIVGGLIEAAYWLRSPAETANSHRA